MELGLVRLHTVKGEIWEEQHWNPSKISTKQRAQISQVLRTIADKIDLDEFSDGDGYKHYPIAETGDEQAAKETGRAQSDQRG